jgi:RND family efflux transporter MFP subunit
VVAGPCPGARSQQGDTGITSDKAPAGRTVFHKVGRGDVTVTIIERGTLEAVQSTPIKAKLGDVGPASPASSIKWIVPDGSFVKKGVKLVELDDSPLRDKIRVHEIDVAKAKMDWQYATKDRDLALAEIKHDLDDAADNVELAEIDLKEAEEAQRPRMEIRLRQAKRALELAKLRGETRKNRAESMVGPSKAALDAVTARLEDLKQQLAQYTLTAPQDGLATYYVSEQARFGIGRQSVVAEGEPVQENQILMTLPDLRRMQVVVKVHESLVRWLRPARPGAKPDQRQAARIVVDAFPAQAITGRVQAVSPTPGQADFWASDVKTYPVTIALDQENDGGVLKPGMSAEVSIPVAEKRGVLRVPIQSVLRSRGKSSCFVQKEGSADERQVTIGLIGDTFVEILDGLNEGESVALNPRAFQRPTPKTPERQEGSLVPGPRDVVVRAVKPPEEEGGGRQARIPKYGLTSADLSRIQQTVPGLAAAAPSRIISSTIRIPASPLKHEARVIATTSDFGAIHSLDELLTDADARFLADLDPDSATRPAVLGAKVAEELFPAEDPLGKTILMDGTAGAFRVVGVLGERPPGKDKWNVNSDVYIPLASGRRLFGERLVFRKPGAFRAEIVDLHEILLRTEERDQAAPAAAVVRALLEESHDKDDWIVVTR